MRVSITVKTLLTILLSNISFIACLKSSSEDHAADDAVLQNANSETSTAEVFGAEVHRLGALTISSDRLTDWQAGVDGSIPNINSWTVVQVPGLVADGVTENYLQLQSAIDRASDRSIIEIPAGRYFVGDRKALVLKTGVVLRGQGSSTQLVFKTGNFYFRYQTNFQCGWAGIQICAETPDFSSSHRILGGVENGVLKNRMAKGHQTLAVQSLENVNVGSWVYLYQDLDRQMMTANQYLDELDFSQIAKVTSIDHARSQITLDRKLNHDFDLIKNPRFKSLLPIQNSGVTKLRLEYSVDSEDKYQPLVRFQFAVNSWINQVELYRGFHSSIEISRSARISIEENYFHHLLYHDLNPSEFTNAYGVVLSSGHDNYVYNNIFEDMRTQLTLQHGASGNIVGYNYIKVASETDCRHGIFFHGHYPHSNLIEGNISNCSLTFDSYWGKQGPFNTVYRNHFLGETSGAHRDRASLRAHHDNSERIASEVNIMGNVFQSVWGVPACSGILTSCPPFDFKISNLWMEYNSFSEIFKPMQDASTVILHTGVSISNPNAGRELPPSLYLLEAPSSWPSEMSFPATGFGVYESSVENPAQRRYLEMELSPGGIGLD